MSDQAAKQPRKSITDGLSQVKELIREIDGKMETIIEVLNIKQTKISNEKPDEVEFSALSAIDRQLASICGIQHDLRAMYPGLEAIIKSISKIG